MSVTLIVLVSRQAFAAEYNEDDYKCTDYGDPTLPLCGRCLNVPASVAFRRTEGTPPKSGTAPSSWSGRNGLLDQALDIVNGIPAAAISYTAAPAISLLAYNSPARRSDNFSDIRWVDIPPDPLTGNEVWGKTHLYGHTVAIVNGQRICDYRSVDIELNYDTPQLWLTQSQIIDYRPGYVDGLGGDAEWTAEVTQLHAVVDVIVHELLHVAGCEHQTLRPSAVIATEPLFAPPGRLGLTQGPGPGPTGGAVVSEFDRNEVLSVHGTGAGEGTHGALWVTVFQREVVGNGVLWRRKWGEAESYILVEGSQIQHVITGAAPPPAQVFAMNAPASSPWMGGSFWYSVHCRDCVPTHTVMLGPLTSWGQSIPITFNAMDGYSQSLWPNGAFGPFLTSAPLRTDRIQGGIDDPEARYQLCVEVSGSNVSQYSQYRQACGHPRMIVPYGP